MNSTFRQIGIATGVALLGSLLASRLSSDVQQGLAGTPLADRGREIADALDLILLVATCVAVIAALCSAARRTSTRHGSRRPRAPTRGWPPSTPDARPTTSDELRESRPPDVVTGQY